MPRKFPRPQENEDTAQEEKAVEEKIRKSEENIAFVEREITLDRKSTRLNSSHIPLSRMPSSA